MLRKDDYNSIQASYAFWICLESLEHKGLIAVRSTKVMADRGIGTIPTLPEADFDLYSWILCYSHGEVSSS
jgi:hypothetical protein